MYQELKGFKPRMHLYNLFFSKLISICLHYLFHYIHCGQNCNNFVNLHEYHSKFSAAIIKLSLNWISFFSIKRKPEKIGVAAANLLYCSNKKQCNVMSIMLPLIVYPTKNCMLMCGSTQYCKISYVTILCLIILLLVRDMKQIRKSHTNMLFSLFLRLIKS